MFDPKRKLAGLARILSQKSEMATTPLSVVKAIEAVEYGALTIKMQSGKPVWLDLPSEDGVLVRIKEMLGI